MSERQNLTNKEAIEKMQELGNNETCFFCTFKNGDQLGARPMATQGIDDDGNIWFFMVKDSDAVGEVASNSKVNLFYGNPGKANYLSVAGEAELSSDKNKIEEYWTPIAKTWFNEGKDDPTLQLVKVKPSSAYFWDTKHGKIVAFIKILAGAITGKETDDSIQGKLNV